MLTRFLFGGKRLMGRRKGENRNVYVDRLPRRALVVGLTLLGLNIADAVFTLVIVGTDLEREANPLARWLLECGTGWFLFSKAFVVALCLLFLLLHRRFDFVKPAIWGLVAFYTVLLGYHFYLMGWLGAV